MWKPCLEENRIHTILGIQEWVVAINLEGQRETVVKMIMLKIIIWYFNVSNNHNQNNYNSIIISIIIFIILKIMK